MRGNSQRYLWQGWAGTVFRCFSATVVVTLLALAGNQCLIPGSTNLLYRPAKAYIIYIHMYTYYGGWHSMKNSRKRMSISLRPLVLNCWKHTNTRSDDIWRTPQTLSITYDFSGISGGLFLTAYFLNRFLHLWWVVDLQIFGSWPPVRMKGKPSADRAQQCSSFSATSGRHRKTPATSWGQRFDRMDGGKPAN